MDVLDLIASILTKVEQDAFDAHSRLVDYRVAQQLQFFYLLDDVVCKLQTLDLGYLNKATRCAAVVNIYNMMMRYPFMKIGVPDSRSARSFGNRIQMQMVGLDIVILMGHKEGFSCCLKMQSCFSVLSPGASGK